MPRKKLESNASLHDIKRAYKRFVEHYDSFVEELGRNLDVLKNSEDNWKYKETDEVLEILQEVIKLKDDYDVFEKEMLSIPEESDDLNSPTMFFVLRVNAINQIADKLDSLEGRANSLKQGLSIVPALQVFLRETSVLFGKFCAAVVNLLMKNKPQQQEKNARKSMLTHFNSLKKFVNTHDESLHKKRTNKGLNL